MSSLSTCVRLTPIASSHPAVRRFLRARRGLLHRDDLAIAVSGVWAHEQVLDLGGSVETFLWCPQESEPSDRMSALVARLAATAASSYQISERTLGRLQQGATAPGLLSIVRLPAWQTERVLTDRTRLVLVADGIEYAGNLGTLMRTVDASGADALVLSRPVARRNHPSVFSASRGTVLTTPTLEFADPQGARNALEAAGFRILVADPGVALDYRVAGYDDRPTAIVVGSEGEGVSPHWREGGTERVAISMRGRADSLNVAAAAAILLFQAASAPALAVAPALGSRSDV